MSARRSIVENALGSVLGALLLAGGAWLLGFWPQVWGFIVSTARAAWSTLSLEVPIWSAMAAVSILWAAFALFRRLRRRSLPAAQPTVAEAPPNPLEGLSDNAMHAMRVLADADGHAMLFDELAQRTGLSRLYLDQVLGELNDRKLIRSRQDILYGPSFWLSALGRDSAIEAGMVPERRQHRAW